MRVLVACKGLPAARLYHALLHSQEFELVYAVCDDDLSCRYVYAEDPRCRIVHVAAEFFTTPDIMMQVALSAGCSLLHPGWGSMSENPELADACDRAGVRFCGPDAKFVRALGDKGEATAIAEACDVPVPVSTRAFSDLEGCLRELNETFGDSRPVMLKAVNGGGGKGIRILDDTCQHNTARLLREVTSEVPGLVVACELVLDARHVEVQLLGDGKNVVAFGTRDCSVQRRRQKVIEECPSNDIAVAARLQRYAVALGRYAGLRSASTVEFVVGKDGTVRFLEVNPRLQVEHIITERLYGVDLPLSQLRIASGATLVDLGYYDDTDPAVAEGRSLVRRARDVGHVMSARIVAESAWDDFAPCTGDVARVELPLADARTWAYFSIPEGGRLNGDTDSQIGHVVAWGATRTEARQRLEVTLSDLRIWGTIGHCTDVLRRVLISDDFAMDAHTTTWLQPWLRDAASRDHPGDHLTDTWAMRVALCCAAVECRRAHHLYRSALRDESEMVVVGREAATLARCESYTTQGYGETFCFTVQAAPDGTGALIRPGDKHSDIDCVRLSAAVVSRGDITGEPYRFRPACCNAPSTCSVDFALPSEGGSSPWTDSVSPTATRVQFPELPELELASNAPLCCYVDGEQCTIMRKAGVGHPADVVAEVSGKITSLHPELRPDRDVALCAGDTAAELSAMKMLFTAPCLQSGQYRLASGISVGAPVTRGQALACFAEGSSNEAQPEAKDSAITSLSTLVRRYGPCATFDAGGVTYEAERCRDDFIRRCDRTALPSAANSQRSAPKPPRQWLDMLLAEDPTCHAEPITEHDTDLGDDGGHIIATPQPPLECGTQAWMVRGEILSGVVVCNDVTYGHGALGLWDQRTFCRAAALACSERVPLIYVASNSGAAMLPDPSLCSRVRCVSDDGVLVLCEEGDAAAIASGYGYGPETLEAAGAMARAMALTERTVPTISLVACRSVGIGAYLNKLSHRVVQCEDSPMLLTGYRAINDVLGDDVYRSNNELGGGDLMACNGIADVTVDTDEEAARCVARWWRMWKPSRNDRTEDIPTYPLLHYTEVASNNQQEYDVRDVVRSFCDSDSFWETKSRYATGVVTGRATLRGRPFGVVAAQCCVTQWTQTADPSAPRSSDARARHGKARTPRVLGSDESVKVSEAIRTCTAEGLPIVIWANWRGFDGGSTSMSERVLAHGSDIVRELSKAGPPVLIRVPRHGILSGGSMVVFSQAINPSRVRMYCDPSATVCVLEPTAAAAILYKPRLYPNATPTQDTKNDIGQAMANVQNDPMRLVRNGTITAVQTEDAFACTCRTVIL